MVSRTDYLLNEVEHFAPYSQFDQSAPREDRVSEQIDIIMKEQQAMGFDRAAIASKSFDIEDQAGRRVDEHTAQKDLVEELKIELEVAERSGEPVDLNDMQALVSQHMNDAQEPQQAGRIPDLHCICKPIHVSMSEWTFRLAHAAGR